MDVLSGVLTGSEFGPGVAGPYQPDKRSGAGHLLIALNIEVVPAARPLQCPDGGDDRRPQECAKLAKGAEEIFYPGEIEARNDQRHRAEGLKLPPTRLRT